MFGALAQELRADRLIAFLQAEALRLLASGGSTRLATLSGGRYELAYPDDEFLVVDRWNGDETRSVRTLSGGETFLASLALALALAEQVSSLAVTKHASLDSLFLDEGFGTLDPETLEMVVEAIEQLGGGGLMVGVITHVRDLADNMRSRLEIEKSQRGSRSARPPKPDPGSQRSFRNAASAAMEPAHPVHACRPAASRTSRDRCPSAGVAYGSSRRPAARTAAARRARRR